MFCYRDYDEKWWVLYWWKCAHVSKRKFFIKCSINNNGFLNWFLITYLLKQLRQVLVNRYLCSRPDECNPRKIAGKIQVINEVQILELLGRHGISQSLNKSKSHGNLTCIIR